MTAATPRYAEVVAALQVKWTGSQGSARCPAHHDRTASLSVSHGADGRIVVHCHAGCTAEAVLTAAGLAWGDLYPPTSETPRRLPQRSNGAKRYNIEDIRSWPHVVAVYEYHDLTKQVRLLKVRTTAKADPKSKGAPFLWYAELEEGAWTSGRTGLKSGLYRQAEFMAAVEAGQTVYLVEGEKDCETARRFGLAATTSPDGASEDEAKPKWRNEYNSPFSGADVVVIPDRDKAGEAHALNAARNIVGLAKRVRLLRLPGLQEHGDLSDWVAAGGTLEHLLRLVEEAPVWQSPADAARNGSTTGADGYVTASDGSGSIWPAPTLPTEQVALQPKSFADMDLKGIKWAWYGWLPYALLVIVTGEQESGKSYFVMALLRSFILGLPWPDGSLFEGETGKVLWIDTESGQGMNHARAIDLGIPLDSLLVPAEDAMGGVSLESAEHRARISEIAKLSDVRAIVLDALRGAHSGDENSSETFSLVKYCSDLALLTGKVVLVVHHLRKKNILDGATIGLDRLRGSSALTQTARVVVAVSKPDPEQQTLRRVECIKNNNLRTYPTPFGFRFLETGQVEWIEAPSPPRNPTAADEAADWLRDFLQNGGQTWKDIVAQGAESGHKERTLRRARDRFCVQVIGSKPPRWGLKVT